VLTGGKVSTSAVKFSKFYLIIDSVELSIQNMDPEQILPFYQKFLAAMRKAFAATKAGESGFKVLPDCSFFNANLTIAESFKMIEEAIVLSGANDDKRKVF